MYRYGTGMVPVHEELVAAPFGARAPIQAMVYLVARHGAAEQASLSSSNSHLSPVGFSQCLSSITFLIRTSYHDIILLSNFYDSIMQSNNIYIPVPVHTHLHLPVPCRHRYIPTITRSAHSLYTYSLCSLACSSSISHAPASTSRMGRTLRSKLLCLYHTSCWFCADRRRTKRDNLI